MMATNPVVHDWATLMCRACWQGGLVVLAIWLICRLLPSMPARLQSWFWRLVVLKFLVLLLLPSVVDLPLLPAPAVVVHESSVPVIVDAPASPVHQVEANDPPTRPMELPSLQSVLFAAWMIGVGWSLVRLLTAWYESRRLRKRSQSIAFGPSIEQLTLQARIFGVRTPPRLLQSPGGGSPMLIGIPRPVILIPSETLVRLSASEQAMVLGHELAHIRRGDLLWGLLASLVRAVFFFHPLVWLAERQLKLAQEVASDELVVARQRHDPIGYGKLLLSVIGKLDSELKPRPLISTISLETAGPVHSLTRRLVAMTRFGRTSRRVIASSGILMATVVLLGLVPWRLVAAEPKESDAQPLHDFGKDKLTLADYEAILNPKDPYFGRKPYRMDLTSYGLVVSTDANWETHIAGVNKRTGEWKWLEMPKNDHIYFEPITGDDVAAFIQHGNPLSQLAVYNGRLNKWATFALKGRVIDVVPCVGDRLVCYQLPDRVVAYSAAQDAWGMLMTKGTPAVGDDSVFVETAAGRYEFPDKNGGWTRSQAADKPLSDRNDGSSTSPAPTSSAAAAPPVASDQHRDFYKVDLMISRTKKNEPKTVVCSPTLLYAGGMSCFSTASDTSILEVTVSSSSDKRPVEHVIEARTIHYPEGQSPRAAEESNREAAPALPAAFRSPDEGNRALKTLTPEQESEMIRRNKEIHDAAEKNAVIVKSPKLILTDGTTGKLTMTDVDGSELEVAASVYPVKESASTGVLEAQKITWSDQRNDTTWQGEGVRMPLPPNTAAQAVSSNDGK